jgi:hypothetical protein
MAEQVAFAPKERFSDLDQLGTVFVNDELEINVREEVAEHGGVVTDDPWAIRVLDRYEPLKRVAVDSLSAPDPHEDLRSLTKAQLLEQDEVEDIAGADRLKVEELRDAIIAVREEQGD